MADGLQNQNKYFDYVKEPSGTLYCGLSGWQYREFKDRFYPADLASSENLKYYANHFKTVEINSTFYHFSRPSTFEKWYEQTPPHFKFAVKANRAFTHYNRLSDPDQRLTEFIEAADFLREKLGPILFQLPPSLKFDLNRLENFLKLLPRDHLFAIEFRHPSWECEEAYACLNEYGVANCIADLRGRLSEIATTGEFNYVRLHGPLKLPYRGAYAEEELKLWSQILNLWSETRRPSYFYFDNTMTGDAVTDAQRLLQFTNSREVSSVLGPDSPSLSTPL